MITVFCLANNEERLMPYFMRHYTQFAKVIILESNSTDRTVEIAQSMGATIWKYEVSDEINDQWFIDLKNNCWKELRSDWVMIVDADEFIYHPDITHVLSTDSSTIIIPKFYNMYSEVFPTTQGQIYEEVTKGIEQTQPKAKMNIFRPRSLRDMNYFPGCHEAFPTGSVRINENSQIKTLHMRNLSKEFVIERNLRARKRNSNLNKEKGWGCHVDYPVEDMERAFEEGLRNAKRII